MQKQIFFAVCVLCVASITVFGQGDLCADIKTISAQYKKDKSKLLGKVLDNDDMMTSYECPLPLSGATSVQSDMYTASKKLAHTIGDYAKDISDTDSQKQFAVLAEQFMKCFPDAKKEVEVGEREELIAVDGNGSYIYLTRYSSSMNTDTWENLYSIHIQIMFYD